MNEKEEIVKEAYEKDFGTAYEIYKIGSLGAPHLGHRGKPTTAHPQLPECKKACGEILWIFRCPIVRGPFIISLYVLI